MNRLQSIIIFQLQHLCEHWASRGLHTNFFHGLDLDEIGSTDQGRHGTAESLSDCFAMEMTYGLAGTGPNCTNNGISSSLSVFFRTFVTFSSSFSLSLIILLSESRLYIRQCAATAAIIVNFIITNYDDGWPP